MQRLQRELRVRECFGLGIIAMPLLETIVRTGYTLAAAHGRIAASHAGAAVASAPILEDHGFVNRPALRRSPNCAAAAPRGLLRVVLLAFTLILANAIAPLSAAFAADATVVHAAETTHHCHDTAPAKHVQHGKACPHCSAGCSCLHGSAAPLPAFVAAPALIPHAVIASRNGPVPPAPALAENLRPPIA